MWTIRWAKRRAVVVLLALFVFLPATGCGGKKGSLKGTVYFKDKPMTGGQITFVPTEGGGGGSTPIDPKDGTYSIANLPLGKMKVIVEPVPTPSGPPGGGQTGPRKDKFSPPKDAPIPDEIRENYGPGKNKNPGKPVPVDKKYRSADTTPVTVTVEKGEKEEDIKVD
jgi:hypothetical protein